MLPLTKELINNQKVVHNRHYRALLRECGGTQHILLVQNVRSQARTKEKKDKEERRIR